MTYKNVERIKKGDVIKISHPRYPYLSHTGYAVRDGEVSVRDLSKRPEDGGVCRYDPFFWKIEIIKKADKEQTWR